ncbi:MAG TPA: chitobiase/beta-hexosaminidase C-terminal domain-containing protein, partial [Catalimonadaceae bacterium]|nr:chitobiase/beta-hexosaminidase C-terminal domain-containing protein [Catalimonadaceae bacterium]
MKPIFAAGTLAAGDQSFCGTGNPGLISFSTQPTTGDSATYKWYYQNGLVTCPTGSSTTGWTLIAGAESNTYDPPAGLTSSRTYAVLVTPVSKRSDGIGQPGGSGGTVCGVATWASGCRKITINALPVAAITPNGPTTFCQGGSVVLTASGGGTYLWSPGNTTTAQRTVSTSGNYSVLVTAANGCTASASVTVTVNSLPGPNAGPDLTFNVNAGNQLITGTPSGGLWSGTGVSLSGSFNTQLAAGTYKLAYCITNASNCSKCDSMVVTLNNVIPVQVATPVITPPTGTYSTTQTISISCATPGASIYYSATGNIPVVGASHTKLYTGPFQILQSATVR